MRILILILLINISLKIHSQDITNESSFKKNTVFLEIGARSGISINYDRILFEENKWKFSSRIGFGFTEYPDAYYNNYFNIPLGLNLLYGRKKSYLEIGIIINYEFHKPYLYQDGTISNNSISIDNLYSGASIAFRHQRPQGGIFYSLGIKPVVSFTNNNSTNYSPYSHTALYYLALVSPFVTLGYSF